MHAEMKWSTISKILKYNPGYQNIHFKEIVYCQHAQQKKHFKLYKFIIFYHIKIAL